MALTQWLSIIVLLALVGGLVQAAQIEIIVANLKQADVKTVAYTTERQIFLEVSEIYNSGSVGLLVRERLEVHENEELVYRGWSSEKMVQPGESKIFELAWHSPRATTAQATTQFFVDDEAYLLPEETLITFTGESPDNPFTLYDFRTYDTYIRFD